MSGGTFARGTLHCAGTYELAGGTLSVDFGGGKAINDGMKASWSDV